ncbi:MAG: RDD family protein [Acidobacteriota bacterium]
MAPSPSIPSPPDAAILALDNVRLDLPFATIGSRTLAASIDHCLLLLLQLVWVAAGVVLLPQLGISFGWVAGALTLGFFLLQWSYFAAFEIAMGGRTPGKLAAGLRVVSRVGGRTTPAAILIRNFLRTFDILIGIPLMAIDRRARRLGDLVGGTLVVHHRSDSEEPVQLQRHPPSWGAREITVVESFLRRAEALEAATAQHLATDLLRWIETTEGDFWAEVQPTLAPSDDPAETLHQILLGNPQADAAEVA